MYKSFHEKLQESLNQFDFHEPVKRPYTQLGSVPSSVDDTLQRVLATLNREFHADSHGMYPHDWYSDDFADRVREEWIEQQGTNDTGDLYQQLYDIARSLIDSDSENTYERHLSDPPISADEQYRRAGASKYGKGMGW